MLDCYRHEYEDMIVRHLAKVVTFSDHFEYQRETNKRAIEVDELRNSNRALSAQVYVQHLLLFQPIINFVAGRN
jgi:hypothetical protein